MTAEIRHIPPEEYHSVKGLSNSGISKLLDCPAKFKAWQDGALEEQTEAMLIGSAFHCLALEPEEFSRRYQVMEHPGNTKAGKEERAAADIEGKTTLNKKQYGLVLQLEIGLKRHPKISRLLRDKGAMREISIFWEEEYDGVIIPCKARLDIVLDVPNFGIIMLDLKSIDSLNPEGLPRAIMNRGYHRQGWWYWRALIQAGLPPRGFYLGAVEKSQPYLAAMIEIPGRAIEQGGEECFKAMRIYADCTRTGHWPGYPEDILEVDFPDWYYRKEINDESQRQITC